MNLESVAAQWVANPRAVDRLAWGWPPMGLEWDGKLGRTLFTVLIPEGCRVAHIILEDEIRPCL